MDIKRIEALIGVIKDARVMELSIRQDDTSVTVRKSSIGRTKVAAHKAVAGKSTAAAQASKTEALQPSGLAIPAPMVGIFHTVEGMGGVGAVVKKGQVVGMIESMKLMNEVVSPADGAIEEIRAEDGMPVGYGQILFRLQDSA